MSELVDEIPGLVEAATRDDGCDDADLVVTVDPSLSDGEYRELLAKLSTRPS